MLLGERDLQDNGQGGRPISFMLRWVWVKCIYCTPWLIMRSLLLPNYLLMGDARFSTYVARAFVLLCKLSERRVLDVFMVAMFVRRVLRWVCMDAWPSVLYQWCLFCAQYRWILVPQVFWAKMCWSRSVKLPCYVFFWVLRCRGWSHWLSGMCWMLSQKLVNREFFRWVARKPCYDWILWMGREVGPFW